MKRAGKAAPHLYNWLIGLQRYYAVDASDAARRREAREAEEEAAALREGLQDQQAAYAALEAEYAPVAMLHDEKTALVLALEKQIEECNVLKQRAGRLLGSLEGEKQKWTVCKRVIDSKFGSLEGDCLVGSALIIYLSPFSHSLRDKYLQKWLTQLEDFVDLRPSDSFDFAKLFGEQIVIKEWIIRRLPSDPVSICNAIIID